MDVAWVALSYFCAFHDTHVSHVAIALYYMHIKLSNHVSL